MSALRLGTRRSALARTQSAWVAERLQALHGIVVDLVEVTTDGDTSTASLASIGGTGVFVTALREALRRGEVDLAVHSLKDLPTSGEPDLVLAAVPVREDPRDVVVARDGLTLAELPAGSRVGTGSPRRAAQLRALGLALDVVDVRGNVDTRLRFVAEGRLDAVVLARSGLLRLGREREATEVLDPLLMLPAPGQGALAVECRADAAQVRALCAALDDPPSRLAVAAERALLATLEAGCAAPVGAVAEIVEGEDGLELFIRAVVASVDGTHTIRRSSTAALDALDRAATNAAVAAGDALARDLLEAGADDLVSRPHTPAGGATLGHVAYVTAERSPTDDAAREGDV